MGQPRLCSGCKVLSNYCAQPLIKALCERYAPKDHWQAVQAFAFTIVDPWNVRDIPTPEFKSSFDCHFLMPPTDLFKLWRLNALLQE